LLAQTVAAACVIPTAAFSQFTLEEPTKPPPDPEYVRNLTEVRSKVEGGLTYVSDDSAKFGKYTGLNEEGFYLDLNFDVNKRGKYDGDSTEYWLLQGENIGLDSRHALFEYGRQGDYKVYLDYDQIPTFREDTARTVFNGVGSSNLSLPAGWVAGQNTSGFSQLLPSLKDVDIEHDRKRLGIGFDKIIDNHWSIKTKYQYETKEGLKTIGGVIGNTGGNPRAAILPEPIDYTEHKFDAVLDYTTKKQQFQIGYHLSLFNDQKDSLTWQNPYSAINGWDASAGFPGGQGRFALPPDNEYHQLMATYGLNVSDTSRFTADLSYARMTQDDAFQNFTVNPVLAAGITAPLPRGSLDGRIDNTLVNLLFSSRPSQNFHWKAQARYEDRNNKTPRDTYVYIGGDSQQQNTGATSDRRRTNEPYSYEELKLAVDGGYRVAKRTELTGGLEYKNMDRTFTERNSTDETTLRLGAKSHLSETVIGALHYERSDRGGETYVGTEPFVSSYSAAHVADEPGGWEQLPDLRKYYLADRTRDKIVLFAGFMPTERVNIGFRANYTNDDYSASEFGLTESKSQNYTLDASFMPTDVTTLYAFGTLEKIKSSQDGRSFSGNNKLADASNPARDWTADHDDTVDTFGVGVKHTIIKNKLDVGADYVYAKSTGKIDVSTGSALTSAPLPDLKTRLHSLSLYGKYKLKTDMYLKLRYRYEKYNTDDWALDGVDPNTLANVLTLGEQSPDYNVHVITLSFGYKF